MKIKANKGFTLIELLVVISIIALLLSILMPALRKARGQARLAICASNQHQIVLGVITYSADNDGLLPPSTQGMYYPRPNVYWEEPRVLAHSADPASAFGGNGLNGGLVSKYLGDYIQEAKVFYCPLTPYNFNDLRGYNGESVQEMYKNGIGVPETYGRLWCDYNLYWNYENPLWKKYNFDVKDTSKVQLLISDFAWFSSSANPHGRGFAEWYCGHPFKRAVKYDTIYRFPESNYLPWKKQGAKAVKVPLNAGYLDGHVERSYLSDWTGIMWAIYFWPHIPGNLK